MFWMSRPPYLRWALGGTLIGLSLLLELRPSPTVPHPFAVADASPGTVLEAGDVEFREVPPGILAPVELPFVVGRPVAAGEPLLPSAGADGRPPVPSGWWALELPVPTGAAPGSEVRVVVVPRELGPPLEAPGVLVDLAEGDGFGGPATGLVAVPPEAAAEVAVGAGEARATVLIGAHR